MINGETQMTEFQARIESVMENLESILQTISVLQINNMSELNEHRIADVLNQYRIDTEELQLHCRDVILDLTYSED